MLVVRVGEDVFPSLAWAVLGNLIVSSCWDTSISTLSGEDERTLQCAIRAGPGAAAGVGRKEERVGCTPRS